MAFFFLTEINIVTIYQVSNLLKKISNLQSSKVHLEVFTLKTWVNVLPYMSPIPALIWGSSHVLTVSIAKLSSLVYLHSYNQQTVSLEGLKWQILTLSPQSHIVSISSLVLSPPIKQLMHIQTPFEGWATVIMICA